MTTSAPSPVARRMATWLLLALLAAALGWGVTRLFALRFARGDVYPPYSTLRTDPLGSKILADAIDGMPGLRVERNFRTLKRLRKDSTMTLVYLGLRPQDEVDENEFAELDSLVRNGVRVIFAFTPELSQITGGGAKGLAVPLATPSPVPAPSPTPAPSATPTPDPAATPAPVAVTPKPASKPVAKRTFGKEKPKDVTQMFAQWDAEFLIGEAAKADAYTGTAKPVEGAGDLDSEIAWRSAMYFPNTKNLWNPLYLCDSEPVVVERSYGKGSIVLCSDAYFLSNEGMRTARSPKLILRLLGENRTVMFDEYHHGVQEHMNVTGLMRKHGLGGIILSLAGVIALFLWRVMVPFLPSRIADDPSASHVMGRDASEGFVNLLRRSVPLKDLLNVCVQEWQKTRGRRIRDEERNHVEAVLRAHESRSATRDPSAAYKAIADGVKT